MKAALRLPSAEANAAEREPEGVSASRIHAGRRREKLSPDANAGESGFHAALGSQPNPDAPRRGGRARPVHFQGRARRDSFPAREAPGPTERKPLTLTGKRDKRRTFLSLTPPSLQQSAPKRSLSRAARLMRPCG